MTLEEFTDITLDIAREEGVEDYLPTLALPATREFQTVEDIPQGVDHREAIQKVVRQAGLEAQEIFFAVRSAPGQITTGHLRPGDAPRFMTITQEAGEFSVAADAVCGWWAVE